MEPSTRVATFEGTGRGSLGIVEQGTLGEGSDRTSQNGSLGRSWVAPHEALKPSKSTGAFEVVERRPVGRFVAKDLAEQAHGVKIEARRALRCPVRCGGWSAQTCHRRSGRVHAAAVHRRTSMGDTSSSLRARCSGKSYAAPSAFLNGRDRDPGMNLDHVAHAEQTPRGNARRGRTSHS